MTQIISFTLTRTLSPVKFLYVDDTLKHYNMKTMKLVVLLLPLTVYGWAAKAKIPL
jgi:hypothetical protein